MSYNNTKWIIINDNNDDNIYIQYGILIPISYQYDLVRLCIQSITTGTAPPRGEGLQNFEHSDLENHTIDELFIFRTKHNEFEPDPELITDLWNSMEPLYVDNYRS